MSNLRFMADVLIEHRDCVEPYDQWETLEIVTVVSDVTYTASEDDFIADACQELVAQQYPGEFGIFHCMVAGRIEFKQDYDGDWDAEIVPDWTDITLLSPSETESYLAQLDADNAEAADSYKIEVEVGDTTKQMGVLAFLKTTGMFKS